MTTKPRPWTGFLASRNMINVFLDFADFALRFTESSFERLCVAFLITRFIFAALWSFCGAMEMGRFHQAFFKR